MHLFFSEPTSHVARGHVSAIWDPGDPHRSPQTTISTYLASFPRNVVFLMAQNPPNLQFASTVYIPSYEVHHLKQDEKLLIPHLQMCSPPCEK